MANVHKLTFNEPQGRNAGLLWTRAVWATAEHKGGEKAVSSLSELQLTEVLRPHSFK